MRKEGDQTRETFSVPIGQLYRSNPQVDIFNKVVYEDMRKAFSALMFDPVNLAKVALEDGTVIWAIVDGHTKVKFALDHGHEHSIENVEAYDSTPALKLNPRIVPSDEKTPPGAITMAQYLRAVIEPTKVHHDIAARRIAAHFINGWQAIVGVHLSKRFPATAALSMLADMQTSFVSDASLQKSVKGQEVLLDNETARERRALEDALIQIGSIVRNTSLRPSDVYKEAFMLVSSKDPIIGGETQSLIELYGMLNLPSVAVKVGKESRQEAIKMQALESLRRAAVKSLVKANQLKLEPKVVADIILDPELSFRQTLATLMAENPLEAHNKRKVEFCRQKLLDIYKRLNDGSNLSESESFFINQFSQLGLRPEDLQTAARIVHDTTRSVAPIQEFLKYAKSKREELLGKGVQEKYLTEAEKVISKGLESLRGVGSPYQLRAKVGELRGTYQQITDTLRQEQIIYQAGVLFDKHLSGRLEQAVDKKLLPTIKASARTYLLNFEDALFNDGEMQKLFASLNSLDLETMLKVFNNRMTLEHALREQRDRQIPATPQIRSPYSPTTTRKEVVRTVFSRPTEAQRPPVTEPIKVKRKVEESQNQQLSDLLREFRKEIKAIELDKDNMSKENKEAAWEVINRLVKLVSGHPDARRVLEIDYPHLLNRVEILEARKINDRDSESREPRY